VSEMNGTSEDLRVDLVIDDVIAGRATACCDTADEALVLQLARLDEIDWPAEEVGDRIAASVAASALPAAGPHRHARHRTGARHPRSPGSRWLAAGAAAAAAALVVLAIQATSSAPNKHQNAPKDASGHGRVGKKAARQTTPGAKTPGATLTAMTIVAQAGTLHAVGAVADSDNFLACVTPSVCYLEGSTDGGRLPDVARSLNGGATWKAGEALPGLSGSTVSDWNAQLSCPKPLTCFSAFGTGLLKTNDGFARYTFQPITLPAGLPGGLAVADAASCTTTRHCVADVTLTDNSQTFIYSDDGGLTWAAASTPKFGVNNNVVGQVRCDRRGACIAAITGGDEQTPKVSALASANGGRSWTMSAAYTDPGLQTWTASCGSADSCLISGGNGTTNLAWLRVTGSGGFSIRVRPIPAGWATPSLVTGSCATGSDCYVETDGSSAGSYFGPMIETTNDDGLTWTSSPMYPPDQSEIGIYLSCPLPGRCLAVAGDSTEQSSTWVVLSSPRDAG
jgi:hypothetical protein